MTDIKKTQTQQALERSLAVDEFMWHFNAGAKSVFKSFANLDERKNRPGDIFAEQWSLSALQLQMWEQNPHSLFRLG